MKVLARAKLKVFAPPLHTPQSLSLTSPSTLPSKLHTSNRSRSVCALSGVLRFFPRARVCAPHSQGEERKRRERREQKEHSLGGSMKEAKQNLEEELEENLPRMSLSLDSGEVTCEDHCIAMCKGVKPFADARWMSSGLSSSSHTSASFRWWIAEHSCHTNPRHQATWTWDLQP